MIWINANPLESSSICGPSSLYSYSSFTDIIGASQDPVALDYWASKNVLIPTARRDYETYSSLDPDYEPMSQPYSGGRMEESFHNYLRRSMDVLVDAGLHATMNQTEMNVYVKSLEGPNPYDELIQIILGIVVFGSISVGTIIILVLFRKQRRKIKKQ
jgi:hypothetical protein